MVARILREQKPDGSWLLNMPSRDRHATFDAVFTLAHEGHGREDCRAAIGRAASWARSCRNTDGGFGHFPGAASDADAVYFQVGTLVMAGILEPANPLPKDPHLLSWGHMMPLPTTRTGLPKLSLKLPAWVGQSPSADDRQLASAAATRPGIDADSGQESLLCMGHRDSVCGTFQPRRLSHGHRELRSLGDRLGQTAKARASWRATPALS